MQFVTPRSLIRMYRHQLRPPTGGGHDADGDGLAGNGSAASARIGARKVRRAVDLLWVDGWQIACDPTLLMPDWPIVTVERGHELAWVYQATFEASGRDGENHVAAVDRERLERVLNAPVWEPAAMKHLGQAGLAFMLPTDENLVPLRATFPDLALRVNRLRHGTPRCGYDARVLLLAAIGQRRMPGRVTGKMRWQAACRLDNFDIEASALLEADGRIHPVSKWRFPDRAKTPAVDAA